MPAIAHPQLANLVRETQQRLDRPQPEFAVQLESSLQNIHSWKKAQTQHLPTGLKQIQHLLHQIDEAGHAMLVEYVSE